MAFDPKDNYTLFFGGGFGGNETWKYSGGTWTQLMPAVSPLGRVFAQMTYDVKDGYMVLFGGQGLNDTWKFAQGSWTTLHPSVSPPAFNPYNSTRETSISGMTYDARDGYVVLVLEYSPGLGNKTTWTFSGGQWTQLHVKGPHRAGACMTYDPLDGYVLLYGGAGRSFSNPYPNNTWRFSGGTWTVVQTSGSSPVGRAYCGLVFDRALNAVVMFGGYQGGWVMNDTWEFAAGTWVNLRLSHSPPALYWFLMTYDRADRYVLLFGGSDGNFSHKSSETWKLA